MYEVAPEPFRVTAVPAHTVWLAPALTVGNAFTAIVWDCVVLTPFIVMVHVYVVVCVGVTVILGVIAPPGLQEYVACPVLYNWVISCWVNARFQRPMSSSLPLK